jgi:hypothetical protein
MAKSANSFISFKNGTMKSETTGTVILDIEVLNISSRGFWLWVDEREHFLDFEDFPWFRDATIAQITDVKRVNEDHFYWPALDIDLHLASIEHPEKFPLKAAL